MGQTTLSLLLPLKMFLPSATSKVQLTTFTTTPLPSLAGPSGVFDTPKEKCPSGHGSRVTGGHHVYSSPSFPSPPKHIDIPKASFTSYGPPTPGASPNTNTVHRLDMGPSVQMHNSILADLATPPATPPAVSPTLSGAGKGLLLNKLFPTCAGEAAAYARSVTIESNQPDGSCTFWDGFVLESPPTPPAAPVRSNIKARSKAVVPTIPTRTLYMSAQNALRQHDRVRESIVALLELAGEHLECDAVVMVLERAGAGTGAKQEFGELLHSLMYVGGTVVTKPPFAIDPRYVLVGIEV